MTLLRHSLGLAPTGLILFAILVGYPPVYSQELFRESFLQHIKYLSSDDLKGRGNGTPELNQAAQYIAEHFMDSGLEGPYDGEYFQEFDVPTGFIIGPENMVTFFEAPNQPLHLRFGEDYHPVRYQEGFLPVAAPLVFTGFGISAPELGYDDYAGVDVEGKIVLVYEHEPQEHSLTSVFDGNRLSSYSDLEYKAREAVERGALGLILLPDNFNHYRDPGSLPKAELENLGLNVIRLSPTWAERLIEAAGQNVRQVRRSINRDLIPNSFPMRSIQAVVRIDVTVIRKTVRNVVGILPGENDSVLVIGAHYDHLGLGGLHSLAPEASGQIHNGADDNASGVAGLLELSRWFAGYRPQHTLVFIAFAGEELGLLGSTYYTQTPVFPLQHTVAMLNMDMIGWSLGELLVGGVGTALEFRKVLETAQEQSDLHFRFAETPRASSDHMAFSHHEIPVLFFFSGLHADYHRPGDDWERIELDRALEVVRVVRSCIQRLDEIGSSLTFVDLDRPDPGS